MFGSERLTEILNEFSKIHLLVVSDLMLDRFIWGDVERLSPEAPVPFFGYVPRVRVSVALRMSFTTSKA